MRTLLVITRQQPFAAAVESALDASIYRVIGKEDAVSAGALLSRNAVDCIVLDLENVGAMAIRSIEEIRALAPTIPLLIYAGDGERSWEEEAYLVGVAHIMDKPVRGKLLQNLLDRTMVDLSDHLPAVVQPPAPQQLMAMPQSRSLETLRRFSSLLVHSLNAPELLRDALQQLREALGVNRAAVFMRKPSALNIDGIPSSDDHWLRPAYTIGHEPGLIQEFPLSLANGIGRYLYRHARILRADHPEARASREITKEFATLGGAIAMPIHDREMLIGVLVIDERITGGGFGDEELAQLFHWLEELGVALRNCWRHEQLAATHGLVDDILAGLGSGCIVIGSNCGVLHANTAALRLLAPGRQGSSTRLDFADIPQKIGSMIFQVLQNGHTIPSFKWLPPDLPGVSCRVSIQPFSVGKPGKPNAALLVLDDITEHERAAQLEMEASKLRLVRAMAWHLAHEIGNAVTPISTMQQLLELQGDDADVRREMTDVLGASVRRITRLTQQMNFLSRDWDGKDGETVRVSDIIDSAYADANSFYPGKKKTGLVLDREHIPWVVTGDTKALRHAFSELILNALQANPENPTVTVRVLESQAEGQPRLAVEVQDAGPGFPEEVARKIGEPFQSTRSVGLGLGLTVSRKIIENHHGNIEIPRSAHAPGVIRVTLPMEDLRNN